MVILQTGQLAFCIGVEWLQNALVDAAISKQGLCQVLLSVHLVTEWSVTFDQQVMCAQFLKPYINLTWSIEYWCFSAASAVYELVYPIIHQSTPQYGKHAKLLLIKNIILSVLATPYWHFGNDWQGTQVT